MYHIYHTEGIILGSRNFGEAGKYYSIFTRDLGMIYASASGVRKLSSKLRYVLQDYAHVKVDLVRGRDFWRVTNVSKSAELENFQNNWQAFRVFVGIARLLQRLLAGEDANLPLFDDFLSGLRVLEGCKTQEQISNVEAVLVLRILNHLGYIDTHVSTQELLQSPFEAGIIFEVSKHRSNILRQINHALKASHL